MSGHSKWANIKHKKERNDKARGAGFTKLARAITVAAREGGGNPDMNFNLRLAMDKARAGNMPKDNIDRAIARGTGEGGSIIVERVIYEGYAMNGVAVLVDCTTDNRTRTVGEVRSVFSRHSCSIGESNSVAWQFAQRGTIAIPADGLDPEVVTMAAIDAGAVDVEADDDVVTVYTEVEDFARVKNALAAAGYDTTEAELAMIPSVMVELDVPDTLQILKFIDKLESLDDVDRVWSNLSISDEAAAAFDAA